MMNTDNAAIAEALADPFDPSEVEFKPQSVKGNRALALAYVDARTVMDRLDSALGLGNWSATYRELDNGVVCKLRVRIGGEWCEHEDVGSFSDQPDDGDKLKAAFSDSLKRVAVHIGVGRYLYRLPRSWADYDPQKRAIVNPPSLPRWALPKPRTVEGKALALPVANGQAAPAGSDSGVLRDAKKLARQASLDTLNNLVDRVAAHRGKTVTEIVESLLTGHGLSPDNAELTDLNNEQMALAVRQCEAALKKPKPAAAQPA